MTRKIVFLIIVSVLGSESIILSSSEANILAVDEAVVIRETNWPHNKKAVIVGRMKLPSSKRVTNFRLTKKLPSALFWFVGGAVVQIGEDEHSGNKWVPCPNNPPPVPETSQTEPKDRQVEITTTAIGDEKTVTLTLPDESSVFMLSMFLPRVLQSTARPKNEMRVLPSVKKVSYGRGVRMTRLWIRAMSKAEGDSMLRDTCEVYENGMSKVEEEVRKAQVKLGNWQKVSKLLREKTQEQG